ncbi:MAG TPA: aminoglycoside phosphotransferase family protein [Candidatus Sumerlaeota bacterium]|nr:MAG: Phosphotransferase enzyme family protein [candidate division BRC1 bacterium ADurb.Bin183]HOE62679.1 aminoglycoside phosphotransferase family protein [Candidatus Sumerlaeota bacterium]HRR29985.1 aminoglycoside phosphotransferase family protein [Candidatus Sumerlaeia bacterium]HON49439.1 aminoglycoside phosphotransferase family protein [Candidatus Sumerlaeota bacterium]HOR64811.1 aminoglycoside phosphotransferase family protein [Candidatus Sumerlaeota bacterium]
MFTDIFHIDNAFRNYITRRLFPLLGCSAGDCAIEVPVSGTKTCIRLVRSKNGRCFIIRAYAKSDKSSAQQLFLADNILQKHGIPSPKVVDYIALYSDKGVSFLTEEYIAGQIWREIAPDETLARRLAVLLARLHSIGSDGWGALRAPTRRGKYGSYRFKKVRHRLHGIGKFINDAGISRMEFRAACQWFKSYDCILDNLSSYQLVHDKLNSGNVICSPKLDTVYLLDFATLHYGYRGKDIAQAELELLNEDPALGKIFLDEYFRHFPPETAEEYEAIAPFCRGYYHLARCSTYLRRDHKSHAGKNAFKKDFVKRFRHHWQALSDIMQMEYTGASSANPDQP